MTDIVLVIGGCLVAIVCGYGVGAGVQVQLCPRHFINERRPTLMLKLKRWRRRRQPQKIDPTLALLIAAQVSSGMAREQQPADHDGYLDAIEAEGARARGALLAIGLMVSNAIPDDERVADQLALGARLTATRDGITTRLHAEDPSS